MSDLLDDFVKARMEPIRDQLWESGEITIAGLRRLDTAIGIDTYGEERTAERYTEASE